MIDLALIQSPPTLASVLAFARHARQGSPTTRIDACLRALEDAAADELAQTQQVFPGAAVHRGGLAGWRLKRACTFMTADLAEPLTLTDIARKIGVSPTHFSRAFKQAMGEPPFTWRLRQRIDRAMTLLRQSDLPIAEVALTVGFSAQPQFTTAFRRLTGVTPGVWRRDREEPRIICSGG